MMQYQDYLEDIQLRMLTYGWVIPSISTLSWLVLLSAISMPKYPIKGKGSLYE
jgi:hypothetical protein